MKNYQEAHSPEEAIPLHEEFTEDRPRIRNALSQKSLLMTVLLAFSMTMNGAIGIAIWKGAFLDEQRCLSPYAQLPRDLPVRYDSHSPFGLGSNTEAERAQAWENLDSSSGEISLDKEWADVHELPKSAPFFWDESRQIYLLNGHHSLHCMRKVRRSIVLYNYNRPQLDSYIHLVHCMDHLMQNIICEADDTPFYTSTTSNITTGLGQVRMCRSWDLLNRWANEQHSCFAYINETQGVDAVIERFRYCPKNSPFLKPMREYFGYSDDWYEERPKDIDSLPRYWEHLEDEIGK